MKPLNSRRQRDVLGFISVLNQVRIEFFGATKLPELKTWKKVIFWFSK